MPNRNPRSRSTAAAGTSRPVPGPPASPAEPNLQVVVALPQSGRTTWLAHHVAVDQAAPDDAPRALWLRGDRRADPPAGVDDLSAGELLAIPPEALADRRIAIDDVHLLHPAHVTALIDHLGTALDLGARVLITSVAIPLWRVEVWERRRVLRWIGQRELRVGAGDYARCLAPFGIRARDAHQLHRELDGWVGPLAAAALTPPRLPGALQIDELAERAIDRAEHTIAALLATLDQVPAGSSLLPTASRPLLEQVFGDEGAERVLQVVQPFSPAVGVGDAPIRPHPVLRRLLERAAPTPPGDARTIRRRAIEWYLAHDCFADAAQLLIEDDRPTEALDLIRSHQVDLLASGRASTQRDLMDQLPRFSWSTGDHLLYAAACIQAGDLRDAAYVLSSPVLVSPDLPVEEAVGRDMATAYLGLFAYPPEICLEAAQRVLDGLEHVPEGAVLPNLVGVHDRRHYRAAALAHRGRNEIVLGRWDDALLSLDEAGSAAHPMLDHRALGFRAWLHGLRGDGEEARRFAGLAMGAASFWPDLEELAVEPRLALAEVHLLEGRWPAAHELADEAIVGATRLRSDHQRACALVVIAEAELRDDQPMRARAALARIGDGAHGFVGRRADAIRARTHLATGDAEGAAAILARLALTQESVLAHALGCLRQASPHHPTAIESWQPPAWRSAEVAHREALAALRSGGLADGTSIPSPSTDDVAPDRSRVRAIAQIAAVHGLSAREAQILLALAAGTPLTEVAASLYISKNTLKTHLSRIYRKLGVHSRREALALVARAELDAR